MTSGNVPSTSSFMLFICFTSSFELYRLQNYNEIISRSQIVWMLKKKSKKVTWLSDWQTACMRFELLRLFIFVIGSEVLSCRLIWDAKQCFNLKKTWIEKLFLIENFFFLNLNLNWLAKNSFPTNVFNCHIID